jgi:dipeptidase E
VRLYLSSERLGHAPEELVRLLRGGTRVALIANAAYLHDPDRRSARILDDLTDLQALGLDPVELDLKDFAGEPDRLRAALGEVDALWVLGGDVLALRAAFVESGADDAVRERLADESLVYAGYSAGACLLGPRLPLPAGLGTAGLDVLPFTILPHYGVEPGVAGATPLADLFIEQHIPFIVLRDGEAVVVDGDGFRVVGSLAPRS